MFCKGGPGKNHQARLPGGLVGLEGLSFISSCTEPWNTVYTHLGPTSPPRAFPWNVSIVLLFRLASGSWNASPYMAFIRGRINCQVRFCRSWPNIFSPNIRVSSPLLQHSPLTPAKTRVIPCSGESRAVLHLMGFLRLLLHLSLLLLLLLEHIRSSHIVFPGIFCVIVPGQKNQELYIKASCFMFKHYLCRTS
jgi:hypothetical protein